jgi:transposase
MKFDGIDDEDDIEKVRTRARDLTMRNLSLEGDVEILLAQITRLTAELATATDRDRQGVLALEIKRLNEQIAAKNRDLFGPSRSERRPGTGVLEESPKAKQKGHGPNRQSRIPVTEVRHELDEADRVCPDCEGALDLPEMEGQTEDSEQITIVERHVRRVLHRRQKYRCRCCGHIDTALGPRPIIPGGRYSPEFAVAVATDKYADHLPLERQVVRFERLNLEISSQTLWDMLARLYQLLLPSYLALRDHLLLQEVLGADESPWRVMGKGRSAQWYVWALTGEDAVFYLLAPSRGRGAARQLLQDYDGVLMADGYTVYKSLERAGKEDLQARIIDLDPADYEEVDDQNLKLPVPRYVLVTCWMHARRGFFQAEKNHPAAGGALDLIAELYRIEGRAEAEANGDRDRLLAARRRLRDTESRTVIARLKAWSDIQKPAPRLKFDDALGYLRNQWPWLIRFLDDPRVPLDNGATERRMRGPVLGRKNHYGSRSEQGTRVAALLYSLIETCKMGEIDPSAYLLEATRRAMETPGNVLMPHEFVKERALAIAESPAG